MKRDDKIIITGAAGLVGQNLICELLDQGFSNITAIDKHGDNLQIAKKLHPEIIAIEADLATKGVWEESFAEAGMLFLLQAQITGGEFGIFERNTLQSTRNVIHAAQKYNMPFTVFTGSSVVNSVADDNYTRSKKAQEQLVQESGLPHCIVRPTLMFGWFDPKHLGWLSRFMSKTPIFPIPGDGKFMRQPLYVRDFCRILIECAKRKPAGQIYDIIGQEDVTYIDIIREIKKVKHLKTILINLPVPLFRFLMQSYGLISKKPPFVADQLDALMAGDYFRGIDAKEVFGVSPTPFHMAMEETFTHPVYSKVVLER